MSLWRILLLWKYSNADNQVRQFSTAAWNLKIINTPLTQKKIGICTTTKSHRQKKGGFKAAWKSKFILQAVLLATFFFSLGIQFVLRDLLDISNSQKIFNVWMKVIFWGKSLSSLFRLFRQELTTVLPAMWYCFTTVKGAENWSRAVHVRPHGFERCTAIFGASFAGLFWALQAPCGVTNSWKERHGSTPQIYTTLDHILAHLLVSLDPPKTCSFAGSIQLCYMLTGFFWGVKDKFAGLFNGFYYIYSGESTSKTDKFDNLRSMKIVNTPLQ